MKKKESDLHNRFFFTHNQNALPFKTLFVFMLASI